MKGGSNIDQKKKRKEEAMKGRGATDKNPTLVAKKKLKILRFGLSNYKSKLTCVTGTQKYSVHTSEVEAPEIPLS